MHYYYYQYHAQVTENKMLAVKQLTGIKKKRLGDLHFRQDKELVTCSAEHLQPSVKLNLTEKA